MKKKTIIISVAVIVLLTILLGVKKSHQVNETVRPSKGFGFGIEYAVSESDVRNNPNMKNDPNLKNPAELFSETNANWIKLHTVSWNKIEPSKPSAPGQHNYDWSYYDNFVLNHQQKGFNIVMTLHADAKWAIYTSPSKHEWASAPPKEDYWEDYASWVSAIVERYDGDGREDMRGLLYPITDFEIESEAQHAGFWEVPPNKDRFNEYARLLKTAYKASHNANPNVRIILSGINIGDVFDDGKDKTKSELNELWNTSKPSIDFVRKSLELNDYFDVVEFHYNMNYLGGYGIMNWIKSKMEENGYSKPIWAGDALIVTPAEASHFMRFHPFQKLGDKLILALHFPSNSYNQKAWQWYMSDQSSALVKKTIVGFDTGMEGIMFGNTIDWPGFVNLGGLRYWVYGGFYGQNDKKLPGSVKGRRPAFYTYKVVTEKIGLNIKKITRLDMKDDSNLFVYQITKSDNKKIYVAWYEDPAAKVKLKKVTTLPQFFEVINNKNFKQIDLSSLLGSQNVKLTHIITEQGQTKPNAETVPSNNILITETPVFIELRL